MKKTIKNSNKHILITICTLMLSCATLHCKNFPHNGSSHIKLIKKEAPKYAQTENNEEDEQDNQTESNKKEQKLIKQAPSPKPTQSSWKTVYNLLPQIFIQSFSTGSDAGVSAFTKTVTKQLMNRHAFISTKNELLSAIEKKSQEDRMALPEDTKRALLSNYFAENKMNYNQLEKQTSLSVILGTAASSALIHTASSMMGALIKLSVGISLQLLMPYTK